ncbi:SDR family oxidoreductase [Archangium violaceum]|uniref:SDR family oxidoreductase n=1 Tax=Archangium violaceum TaxID=83451 RepID=UPI002B2EFCA8|nr:SDR family oxidoreductase [Archangium violaceum]
MKPLEGRIAVVAGATRGAGRGIAMMLGEAGATVYCTGRSVRGRPATGTRPETIEETAELVSARGGRGIAVRVDHTVEAEVAELFERLKREQERLDVLVNDVWGGDELTDFGQPFWKLSPEKGRLMLDRGIYSHILTSRYAVPLMLERDRGLIVEITDGDSFGYRGNLFYDLVKLSVIRLAFSMAWELRRHPITSLAVTPGFLRSEAMLEGFGVTEANWRDATAKEPHFIASETPFYVGRAVAALAADPNVAKKAGRVFSSWQLAKEYGFKDVDGRQPDWGEYFQKTFGRSYSLADEAAYATWSNGLMEIAYPDWPKE